MKVERTLRVDMVIKDGMSDDKFERLTDVMFARVVAVLDEIPEIVSVEGASWGPTDDEDTVEAGESPTKG